MIGLVVKIKVKADKTAEFEAAFKEAQAGVRAEEPGCVYYDLYKANDDAQTYFVLERYKDQAAVQQHQNTKHFAKMMESTGGLTEGAPEMSFLSLVSGLK
jgi:quinol monooxygenase YgiN